MAKQLSHGCLMSDNLVEKITEYWNRQPCNINHSLAEVGSEQFFVENSQRRYFVEPHLRDLAQFHQYQGRRVPEIGCGLGADAVEFVRHGAEYVGIDLSSESVALARKRFETFDLEGRFLVMDGANTAAMAELGHFDLVYSCGVLHHYPDLPLVLRNIYRALNPGGDLRFLVYAKNSWKYAMIRAGLDQFEAQAGCPYAQAYTQEEIHQLLEGFDVINIRQAHCFMYNVALYKQGVYQLEPWFEAMSEQMREAVRQNLGWHLLVHARKQ